LICPLGDIKLCIKLLILIEREKRKGGVNGTTREATEWEYTSNAAEYGTYVYICTPKYLHNCLCLLTCFA